jgi:hypothetical protein
VIDNKIYNPAAASKDWLIEHFVVRTKVFEKIFKDILNGKMQYPEQHYIIQGQRGMGKTTLLLRLKYEIENTEVLNKWLIPVFFNEESYDLTSLSNLWEKLIKYLDDLWYTNGVHYKKTDEFIGKSDYEKLCYEYLQSVLKSNEKKMVLFFDNFGELFLDNLEKREQQRLREILMNCADIRIIGASAVVMDDLYDYSKPFFEFFRIINLEGLNKEETFKLIEKIQEKVEKKIDLVKQKAKIETLAILTGGVIRTVMLIYEAILADEDGSALKDLESVLDKITPLYKHRIEDLPKQQRKIIDVIAKKWDAISAKEIAENIRENGVPMQTKLISAQLQQLEKNNIIEKKQTNTKNHLYQLKERFFNIWYLMRNGDRNDKCKVIWLTRFLEVWYEDKKGFDGFIKNHVEHLRSGKYHQSSALLITEALANSSKLDIFNKDLLVTETTKVVNKDVLKYLPDLTNQKQEILIEKYENENFEEAINLAESIKIKNNPLNFLLASSYININNNEKAKAILDLIESNTEYDNYSLGILYPRINEFEKSIFFLEKCKDEFLSKALNQIGNIYKKLNKKELAINALKKSIELENNEAFEDLVKILIKNNQIEEAEEYYEIALKRGVKHVENIFIDGLLLSTNGKMEAQLIINRRIKENPQNPYLNHFKGLLFYYSEEITKAYKLFEKANSLFKKANIKDTYYGVNYMFYLDLSVHEILDKEKSLYIVNDLKRPNLASASFIGYNISFAKIWNNNFKEGLVDFFKTLNLGLGEFELDRMQNVILLLLAKKQYHSVLKIFNDEKLNLKDKIKPIYYALMIYLKDEFPNEHIKMGEELKQPVEDIMKRIDEMAITYS